MPIKAIIADDENELRRYLKTLLKEAWPELVICAEAANGEEVLALTAEYDPQVVFLDIRMPGLSGLDAAQSIMGQCHIVFVTAYDQYAVTAFEREAIDYIVKPVTPERLARTVDRLKKQMEGGSTGAVDLPDAIRDLLARMEPSKPPEYLAWIRVQQKEMVRLIETAEVDYFQAADKYTLVVTAAGEFPIKKSIKALCRELDPQMFWQVHRGTIVNVTRIEGVSRSLTGRGVLRLNNRKELLTVSRQYLHLFKLM